MGADEIGTYRFLYGPHRLSKEETPKMAGMEMGRVYKVEANLEQVSHLLYSVSVKVRLYFRKAAPSFERLYSNYNPVMVVACRV